VTPNPPPRRAPAYSSRARPWRGAEQAREQAPPKTTTTRMPRLLLLPLPVRLTPPPNPSQPPPHHHHMPPLPSHSLSTCPDRGSRQNAPPVVVRTTPTPSPPPTPLPPTRHAAAHSCKTTWGLDVALCLWTSTTLEDWWQRCRVARLRDASAPAALPPALKPAETATTPVASARPWRPATERRDLLREMQQVW
jgi:hypothetical protein